MLLKANSRMANATKMPPALPTSALKAACVSCTPFKLPSKGTPLKRIMNAVQVQITNVSEKTPNAWINPCFTGWVTWAVAATFGAEPIPASLLNKPRLMPCIKAAPTVPPNACSHPNALDTMVRITVGSSVMLNSTIPKAKAI